MAKVVYHPSLRGAERAEVKRVLEKQAHLFPEWLSELHVKKWQQQNEDDPMFAPGHTADVVVRDEYREVSLVIHEKFFKSSKKRREDVMKHEIAHMHLGPVDSYVHSIIGNLEVTDDVYEMNLEQYRRVTERMAEDLSRYFK